MHGSPLGAELRGEAEAAGFPVWDVAALAAHDAGFVARLDGGGERELDFVYAAMGCSARSGLVRSLGIACEDDGSIPTGKRQETGLPGVYAIGDVVEALNQIAVAFGHAALAATHIHNSLRGATEA
jgi:thioredoxin reductase (NADPH)